MSVMKKPDSFYYLEKPLEDDLIDFLLSDWSFFLFCGKALAYAECLYSAGLISEDEANELIELIYEVAAE